MSLCSLRRVAALILLPVVVSCSSGTDAGPVEIRFGLAGAGAAVRNLQFYVHEVELLDEQGAAHALQLTPAAPWQSGEVALMDLAGDAAAPRNETLRGALPSAGAPKYVGIRFSVGVPFGLNHANPLTAAAPLDRGDLFWTWQSGYKFLRADFAVEGRDTSFHLGSTGCSSASALRPPAQPCAQPNRMRVELRGDPIGGVIRFHLPSVRATACTGDYAHDPACSGAYASTALQPASGVCGDEHCSGQKLWTLD